jgi:hypothetical protein
MRTMKRSEGGVGASRNHVWCVLKHWSAASSVEVGTCVKDHQGGAIS